MRRSGGPYRVVRPFLVLPAEALPLGAAPAGQKRLSVTSGSTNSRPPKNDSTTAG